MNLLKKFLRDNTLIIILKVTTSHTKVHGQILYTFYNTDYYSDYSALKCDIGNVKNDIT